MNFAYMSNAVSAALGLILRNQRAWDRFDITTDGFYRSFAAILLVIPLNLTFDLFIVRLSQARDAAEGVVSTTANCGFIQGLFSTIVLIASWVIFPLAMVALLSFLKLSERYAGLIIAYNWSRVVTEALNIPLIVIYSLGLMSVAVAYDFLVIILALTLYVRYYVARSALGVNFTTAMGIAILDLMLLLIFTIGVNNTAHLWLPPST